MPYGSVLIVDDVETNIYVARGLLAPYGLKIDAAESGFEAIDRVKEGNVYDIIFMDHMMPKMDGIEATKIIRELGYVGSIVALTANAVTGQSDIFLGNGFDDFISKPIDIRQLNNVLNKLVRDRYPDEVVEATRKQASTESDMEVAEATKPLLDAISAEIFTRDAQKALTTLEDIVRSNDYVNEDNMRSYIINVHGMKSALANVGKMDLSAIANRLEDAARDNNIEVITSETPFFLDSLKTYTEELAPTKKERQTEISENKKYLFERLNEIKVLCSEYDASTAGKILRELRSIEWAIGTEDLLRKISILLLHSDFDDIVEEIDGFIK